MCSPGNTERIGMHKEARSTRVNKDEHDVQSIVSYFTTGLIMDPFSVDTDEDSPLTTTATGVVKGEETRSGTEKLCSYNLQSGRPT